MTKLTNFSTYNMQKILKFYRNRLLDKIENSTKEKEKNTILEKNNFALNSSNEKKKKIIPKIYTYLFSHIEKNKNL
jgi:predicted PolB exonuclease-like 3'-5' exonuclease